MDKKVQVFLFGDQSSDTTGKIRALLEAKEDPILVSFLDRAYDAIRSEIAHLPLYERQKLPRFYNLADIIARQKEGLLNPAFQTALTCLCQLGYFIRQHSRPNSPYPQAQDTYLLGLCTGALAAAAISSCRSLSELLPLAAQSITIAFRLGLLVVEVGQRIEPHLGASWTLIFPGVKTAAAAAAIRDFSEKKHLPPQSQPWISAHISNGTSVSGPPTVLADLRKFGVFANGHPIEIPVRVPGHASHLFTNEDIQEILKTISLSPWSDYEVHIPVCSPVTGKLMEQTSTNFRSLVEKCLQDILLTPLRWDNINEQFPQLLKSAGVSSIKIVPLMTSTDNAFKQTLEAFTDRPSGSPRSTPGPSIFSSIEIDRFDIDLEKPAMNTPGNLAHSKLAIVGFSGRFPDSESPEAFWEILRQGIDTVRKVPKSRWDVDTHVDFTGRKNTGEVPWGCFIPNVEKFDARFFSISPKEAPQMDPAQRLSLMTTYEAMENAGIVPGTTPSTKTDRIGTYLGVTSNDYFETNTAQNIDTYFITGGNRAFIPGRINFCFEFCGPSYSVDTACSSSLSALHMACNALWRGDVDTAFACGTNMINNPDGHTGLDRGFFLSKTGNCKTFDDGADGYCRGEGVVTIIVKRLEDALADNDPVLAVIGGTQTNHSGESDSITRPHAPAQKILFDRVLNMTGTKPDELGYIEMHGTGTQVGDAVEMESVLDTFAPKVGARAQNAPLYLGAAKANIGHGEGVSGITSVAKVLLMFQNNTIPPHCGIKTKINHNYPLDLKERNVHIAMEEKPWTRSDLKPRKVLINNFSAAGGNTALLLEDGPAQGFIESQDPLAPTMHAIAITAKCAESLKGNLRSLLNYLENVDETSKSDFSVARLAYTTTARRLHWQHRVMVSGTNINDLKMRIEEAIVAGHGLTRTKAKPKITFAFTGQGSQYLGMGKQLYQSFSQFRQDIHRFDQIARGQGFPSFCHVYTAEDATIDDQSDTYSPPIIQLAISCLQMAIVRLWKSWGIIPNTVVGHSLGEYAALNAAGVLSDSDTIYLVGKRAELLEQQCRVGTHAMLAVKSSVSRAREVVANAAPPDAPAPRLQVCCVNGPDDTVLGGPVEHVKTMQEALATAGIKSTILKTPYAFHTSQVFSILGDFEAAAKGVVFHKPTIPVVSPLLGNIVTGDNSGDTFGPKYLARHCRETVNIHDGLLAARTASLIDDKSCVIEIGPNPVVSGMVKATLGNAIKTLPTLQKNRDVWHNLATAMSTLYTSGHDFRWQTFHHDFKSSHRVLKLPAYSWDLKKYWIPYEYDWAILKGAPDPTAPSKIIAAEIPSVECTAIHRLVEERTFDSNKKALVIVETDISRDDINGIAQGHKVNGIALTTPSVYAEIGLSLGEYLVARFQPSLANNIVDISNLVVEKALIPHCKGPQLLHTSADVDWNSKSAKLIFRSVDKNGKPTVEHGSCTILFTDNSELIKIKKKIPSYLARIKSLTKDAEKGTTLRLNQNYGYKLISSLAQFHPDYRAIDEVILDSSTLEACTKCSFGQVKSQGKFSTHPAYIDVMTQTAGFVMNAKDSTDLDMEVFVNHGWKSLQIFEELSPNKSYSTYVHMTQDTTNEEGFWKGDTIMLDEKDNVVAFFKDVTLRRIVRQIFHKVLDASNPARDKAVKLTKSDAPSKAKNNAVVVKPKALGPISKEVITVEKQRITTKTFEAPVVGVHCLPPQIPLASFAQIESKIVPALNIIAEETGLAIDDLTDESVFADIGVDSLLSMVIASRFREELGLDLDLEFSLFLDLPTVKHLRDFLQPQGVPETTVLEVRQEDASRDQHPAVVMEIIDVPAIEIATVEINLDSTESLDGDNSKLASALAIVAEESGLAIEDLTDDTNFGDIGVDSLLSMVIASRFREELGLDLELEFSLFVDLPTVKNLRDFLNPRSGFSSGMETPLVDLDDSESLSSGSSASAEEFASLQDHVADQGHTTVASRPSGYCRPATSVILQGLPDQASRTLILFPDGGGSSSSYDPLPKFKTSDTAIIGLNCPYARDPENLKCNLDDLIGSYLVELRRRQPHGPYHLGGWSSGGIFAYIATQKLVAMGEEVLSLLIIDSPVPRIMDRLPKKFYEYVDSLGLFGYSMGPSDGGKSSTPKWLIPHFQASVEVLQGCTFAPLTGAVNMPKVSIIWAGDAVLKDQSADQLPELATLTPGQFQGHHFLLEQRTDFGPWGWEEMLPGAEIVTDTVHNANHFSMMQKPFINQVGQFLERGLVGTSAPPQTS